MDKFRLLTLALTTLFIGCSPMGSILEWKSDPEYRAFISTRIAESVISYEGDEDEEIVEELCDGSGWIVHGDGHKTPCPGCDACDNNGEEPTEVIITEQEPRQTIEFQSCPTGTCPTSRSNCYSQTQKKGFLRRLFGR